MLLGGDSGRLMVVMTVWGCSGGGDGYVMIIWRWRWWCVMVGDGEGYARDYDGNSYDVDLWTMRWWVHVLDKFLEMHKKSVF